MVKEWKHCKCGHAYLHHYGVCRTPGCKCKKFVAWKQPIHVLCASEGDGWLKFIPKKHEGEDL